MPFFISRNVPIVTRGGASIMLKDIGVEPVPNYTKDIKKGNAPWDAYVLYFGRRNPK